MKSVLQSGHRLGHATVEDDQVVGAGVGLAFEGRRGKHRRWRLLHLRELGGRLGRQRRLDHRLPGVTSSTWRERRRSITV